MLRSALGNRRTSRRLSDEHHRITTPRRRCIRRQNFNSSGPLANFRNGEQFLRKIDRPRRHGGGSPRSDVVAQHEEMGALLCNPVSYRSLDHLGIDPSTFEWRPMPERRETASVAPSPSPRPDVSGLTMAEAKQGLAITFGVQPEAIEIVIRG